MAYHTHVPISANHVAVTWFTLWKIIIARGTFETIRREVLIPAETFSGFLFTGTSVEKWITVTH